MERQTGVGDQLEVISAVRRHQRGCTVGDRDDAEVDQFGHRRAAGHVAYLKLVAGGGAVRTAGLIAGALQESRVDEERGSFPYDAGGRTGKAGAALAGSVFSPCVSARSSKRRHAWRTKASTPLTVMRPM